MLIIACEIVNIFLILNVMFFGSFAQLNKKCDYIINNHDIHQSFCDLNSSINSLNEIKVLEIILFGDFLMNQTNRFYNMNLSIM